MDDTIDVKKGSFDEQVGSGKVELMSFSTFIFVTEILYSDRTLFGIWCCGRVV